MATASRSLLCASATAALLCAGLLPAAGAQPLCDTETISPILLCEPTTTTSTPSETNITLGETVNDTAVVASALPTWTETVNGTVAFYLCGPGATACLSGGEGIGNETLSNGTATSPDVQPDAPGEWCFRAEYLGNDTWLPSQDGGPGECFNVTEAIPTATVSTPTPSTVSVGSPVRDVANVTASAIVAYRLDEPTGNVTFHVCAKGVVPCSAGGDLVGNATLTNGTAESPPFVPTDAGTYCFRAEYGGDAEFAPSEDNGTDECFTVTAAVPFFPSPSAVGLALAGTALVLGVVILMRRKG